MAKQLTMTAVLKMRPGAERIEVHDKQCKGLTLIIRPSGHKSWAMRFRLPSGKLFRMTLAPVDLSGREANDEPEIGKPMTLAAARRMAAEVQRKRALGHDFKAAKHKERFEREAKAAATFSQATLDFVEQHVRPNLRRWHDQARLLGVQLADDGETLELVPKGLADRWRDRSVHDIDIDDIYSVVDEAREKGVPGRGKRNKGRSEPRARKLHAALSKMFAWLLDRRRVKANPCAGIKTETPKSRRRVLNDAEIVWFWAAAGKLTKPFGHALRLLLLTGDRRSEVDGMRLSELSQGGALWTIPGERTKNHLDHDVPLPPLARDIIEELVPMPGAESAGSNSMDTVADLIFTTTGTTPISGWSKMKKRLDELMLEEAKRAAAEERGDPSKVKIAPWRLHDLRRTCATCMADIGVLPHIVESCLNHISGVRAGVAGTYNRARYRAEKKAALERWATHVDALVSGRLSNVVPFQAAGAM